MQPHAPLRAGLGVRHHALDDLPGLRNRPGRIDVGTLEFSQQGGAMIGSPPDHYAVHAFAQVPGDSGAVA